MPTKTSKDQGKADTGETPLFTAARKGHVEVVPFLVGAGCRQRPRHDRWFWSNASTFAANEGHLEVVQFLVGSGSINDHCSNGILKF